MKLLSFERRWLLTILAAMYPSGADERLPVGAADVPVRSFLDDLWRHAPTETLLGVRLATWVIAWSPLFTIGRPTTFARLKDVDRVRVLERLAGSRVYAIRELAEMLKMMGAFPYAGHDAVQRAVGLPAPVPSAWVAEDGGADD